MGSDEIDFDALHSVPKVSGHVIAARITAENPDEVSKMYCVWLRVYSH